MTHEQKRHLQQRLDGTLRVLRERVPNGYDDHGMPPQVRRAKVTIERWRAQRRREAERARSTIDRSAQEAREAILFGDPAKALKAVQQFERNARRRYRTRKKGH